MLQVLEVEVLPRSSGDPVTTRVPTGWFFVVPRGCWQGLAEVPGDPITLVAFQGMITTQGLLEERRQATR